MKELTVIILSQGDEDVIGDAILSVQTLAQEIIVVDSNKNTATEKIATKLKAKVIRHPFKNFSDQRNFAILHATTPWVLYLDSDERVTSEFCHELENVISHFDPDSGIAGFYIKRKTYYYGRDWNFEDRVQRIFLRNKFIEWKGVVHETPVVKGSFGLIQNPINHFTHRNLSQMVRKTNAWSEFEAKLRYDSNHPPLVAWRFFRVMATEFWSSYFKNKGYRNGTHGVIEGMYQAFSIFITYAKLWELQQKKRG